MSEKEVEMTDSSKKSPPSATADKFMLRFNQDGLRKELKVRAAQNERTLTAEILYLIKRGLAAEQVKEAQHEKQA
ncbi:MAG: hypothetical protein PHE74_00015 [Comamonas sp.]|nr:hypothetical protein [Comamonas sp.]